MQGIAGGGETGLCEQRFVGANAKVGDGPAAGHDLPEGRCAYPACEHRKLDDEAGLRGVEAEPRHGSDGARTTDCGRLDSLAVAHHDNDRDHPRKREIDLIDFATRLE